MHNEYDRLKSIAKEAIMGYMDFNIGEDSTREQRIRFLESHVRITLKEGNYLHAAATTEILYFQKKLLEAGR